MQKEKGGARISTVGKLGGLRKKCEPDNKKEIMPDKMETREEEKKPLLADTQRKVVPEGERGPEVKKKTEEE